MSLRPIGMTRGMVAALALAAGLWLGAGAARAAGLIPVPPGHDSDLRWIGANGVRIQGAEALGRMADADLIVWLAGNQFFAMDRVIGDFQRRHPGVSVGLITLPPGLILEAIQAGGWTYQGRAYPLEPDIYGSVSTDQLRATGRIRRYETYTHNALELMVAKGNPKHVRDLRDLTRPDLRVTLPNPLTEGIMTFYGKPILVRMGLWPKLSPGPDCAGCDPTPTVHFAVVHHREIPARIAAGQCDVGLVWRTETRAAIGRGAPVEGIPLPPSQSAIRQVGYVAGPLERAAHAKAARQYLAFLASPAGQRAYAAFGFIEASRAERTLRPLPRAH